MQAVAQTSLEAAEAVMLKTAQVEAALMKIALQQFHLQQLQLQQHLQQSRHLQALRLQLRLQLQMRSYFPKFLSILQIASMRTSNIKRFLKSIYYLIVSATAVRTAKNAASRKQKAANNRRIGITRKIAV